MSEFKQFFCIHFEGSKVIFHLSSHAFILSKVIVWKNKWLQLLNFFSFYSFLLWQALWKNRLMYKFRNYIAQRWKDPGCYWKEEGKKTHHTRKKILNQVKNSSTMGDAVLSSRKRGISRWLQYRRLAWIKSPIKKDLFVLGKEYIHSVCVFLCVCI